MDRPEAAIVKILIVGASGTLGAVAAAVLLLGVVVPVTTTPQPDNAGRLADRQFFVRTPLGGGYARYFGTGSLDGDSTATRAIVIVHGVLRDADYYYDTGVIAADAAHALTQTLVVAPQFVERSELAGQNVSPQTLYWNGRWPGGSDAISPAPISTYDVFDAIIARLSDQQRFPKMGEIVVVGHSAGGQIVQRYAVVGKAPQLDPGARVPVHLVVSNPSSYLYFTDWRPVAQSNCPDFNQWRYGLKRRAAVRRGNTCGHGSEIRRSARDLFDGYRRYESKGGRPRSELRGRSAGAVSLRAREVLHRVHRRPPSQWNESGLRVRTRRAARQPAHVHVALRARRDLRWEPIELRGHRADSVSR